MNRTWETGTLLALLWCGAAAAEPLRAGSAVWIADSWAALRVQPNEAAEATGHLSTNAKVTLASVSGGWCQVEAPGRRGWLKCNSLSSAALTLESPGTGDENEARKRAFWIAPTWARLLAVGTALPSTALNDAQRQAELAQKELRRHALPEFEAMKARLSEGAAPRAERELDGTLNPVPDAPLPKGVVLPAAKPSFFRSRREFAITPTPDQMAALRNGTIALKTVTEGPGPGKAEDGRPVIKGAWDIGEAELQFLPAVTRYSISERGTLAASAITSVLADAGAQEPGCPRPNPMVQPWGWKAKIEQPVPGYADVPADGAVVRFFPARDLKPGTVQVTTRLLRYAASGAGRTVIAATAVHEIDLDGDGNPDMVQMAPAYAAPGENRTLLFVNVNGAWSRELDYRRTEKCP